MNKPNATNPGASSTLEAIQNQTSQTGVTSDTVPPTEQAYENSAPGTVGNTPGEHKAVPGARVDVTMKANSKTAAEAEVPDAASKDSAA